MAGTLAIELASTEVDVRGAVSIHPGLGDKASRASIAGVEGNRLEDGEHFGLDRSRWPSILYFYFEIRPGPDPSRIALAGPRVSSEEYLSLLVPSSCDVILYSDPFRLRLSVSNSFLVASGFFF